MESRQAGEFSFERHVTLFLETAKYCRLAQNSPQSRGVRDLFSPGRSLELDKKAGLNKAGGKHKSMKDPIMIKEVTMIWWRVEAQAGLMRRWKTDVMTEVHENQKLCQWARSSENSQPTTPSESER